MSKADEYRRYAEEALQSARNATSDDARKQFFDLAKMWMTAAQQTDDGIAPPVEAADGAETAH